MDLQLTDDADDRAGSTWPRAPCRPPNGRCGWPSSTTCSPPRLRSIERTGATAVRMLLAGDAGLAARTQALADAESRCCSFFTFGVTPLEDGARGVRRLGAAGDVGVLDGLVGRAAAALGGAA